MWADNSTEGHHLVKLWDRKRFESLLEGEKHPKIIFEESSLGDYKVVYNTYCCIAIKYPAVLLKCMYVS